MTEVSQADREAAAEFLEALHREYPGVEFTVAESHGEEARQGRCDNSKLVQAFARHAAQARREARREAAGVADEYARDAEGMTEEHHAALSIASAILSLNGAGQ